MKTYTISEKILKKLLEENKMREYKRLTKNMIEELKQYKYLYVKKLHTDDHKHSFEESFEIDGENFRRLGLTNEIDWGDIFKVISAIKLERNWFTYIYVSNSTKDGVMKFDAVYFKKPKGEK